MESGKPRSDDDGKKEDKKVDQIISDSQKAIAEARDVVQLSDTILVLTTPTKNDLYRDIYKRVTFIRKKYDETFEDNIDPLRVDPSDDIYNFDKNIQKIRHTQAGNCEEFAMIAMDYFITNVPHLKAELYRIVDGDHVFVVVGRDPGSDPSDPKTWGVNAVICDAWAGEAYKATEYLNKLKKYYQGDYAESGDHETIAITKDDKLEPTEARNSDILAKRNEEKYLREMQEICLSKLDLILTAITELETDLIKISKTAGKDSELSKLIKERILIIDELKKQIQKEQSGIQENIKPDNYHTTKKVLQLKLQHCLEEIKKINQLALSKEVKPIISPKAPKESKLSKLHHLFKKRPDYVEQFTIANEKFNGKIKKLYLTEEELKEEGPPIKKSMKKRG